MRTLKLTKADFGEGYQKKYIGKENVADFDGHIEIEGGLSWCVFVSLKATGYIHAGGGSGIKAGESIEAGWGIKAGEGIKAGSGIKAGWGIEAGWGIVSFFGSVIWII